jgi:uncharacterized lipoprotein
LIAGCSSDEGLRCEDVSQYAGSVSVPPLRVPDDLTVPDESDSLLIPDSPAGEVGAATECLETPPSYYEQDNDDRR